ncbi:MAG: OB-fold domain-containing protein [Candidatus Binatia bacterium]
MRVAVDRRRCQGHARCVELAPGVFRLDGEGYSTVAIDEVPGDLEESARRALRNCPEAAISVVRELNDRPATELPLPRLTPESSWFWTAGATGRLVILRCRGCRRWIHPPSPLCPACRSTDVSPEPVAGRGTLFTFTVNHQPFLDAIPPPYVVAIVELDEQPGLQLTTRIVGCAPTDVRIGMRVALRFEGHGDVYLPLFAPESADG